MVRIEAKGFKKLDRENVVLEVGKDVQVDVTVQPGERTETVTVTDSIPLVQTTNYTLGGHPRQRGHQRCALEWSQLPEPDESAPRCDAPAGGRPLDPEHQQHSAR